MDGPRICVVMLGAPFDSVVDRIGRLLEQLHEISPALSVVIDRMPAAMRDSDKDTVLELAGSGSRPEFVGWPTMNFPQKAAQLIWIDVRMMKALLALSNRVDIAYFVTGMPFVLPSIILAKLLGLRVVIQCGGTAYYARVAEKRVPSYYDKLIGFAESLCFRTADLLAVETPKSSRFLHLDTIGKNIAFFGSFTFVDTTKFVIDKSLEERGDVVGYLGRLTEGKGVLRLLKAAKILVDRGERIRFLIAGEGPALHQLRREIAASELDSYVELLGGVSYRDVPRVLNRMRLFVHVSSSEGLPHTILEAMACGTLVLATPVGGIPDVVKEMETGFLLHDTTPDGIADAILQSIAYPGATALVDNARKLIESDFSFAPTVKRHAEILHGLIGGNVVIERDQHSE